MCGISVIFDPQEMVQDKSSLIDRMTEMQKHRGPDYSGVYRNEKIAIGHNRLSLLDLTANGNQPFITDRYVLAYNGEIYNFRELRTSIEKQYNYKFKSNSDTEVLSALLETEGIENALKKIKGMFAFVWYDKSNNSVIAARDRIGIKPLYYSVYDKVFYIASEYKSINAVHELQIEEIRAFFSVYGILEKSRNYTIYKNLFSLPPGYYLKASGNGVSLHKYFELEDFADEDYYRTLSNVRQDEIVERFAVLLEKSVNQMLITDAKIGAFVSGGIDSSLIAALAKASQPIEMYTANVLGRFSEYEDAKLLSNEINADLFDYKFRPEQFLDDLAWCTWHMEMPIITHVNAVPFARVAELARARKAKAVLTGEGSDELFLGYPTLLTRRYDSFIKGPLNLVEKVYRKIPGLGKYVLRQVEQNIFAMQDKMVQGFERQNFREKMKKTLAFRSDDFDEAFLSFQMLREGIVALMHRNDRMGMICSVESRFPFLDDDVLKFGLNLPVRYKIHRIKRFYNFKHPFLVDKWIVRKLAERYLSDKLVYKKKNGFPLYGYNYSFPKLGIFKNGFVESALKVKISNFEEAMRKTDNYTLSKFMALETWYKLFVERKTVSDVQNWLRDNVTMKINA